MELERSVPFQLTFCFSRGLDARHSSATSSVTIQGCGTRQLWADGLPVARGNLPVLTHLEVAIRLRVFHWLWCQDHVFFTHFSRVFVDTTWFLFKPRMLPQKEQWWMRDLIWWLVISNIIQVVNREQFEPFPHEPSNIAQGMEAWSQSTSFETTSWKGLGKLYTLERCQFNQNWEFQGYRSSHAFWKEVGLRYDNYCRVSAIPSQTVGMDPDVISLILLLESTG